MATREALWNYRDEFGDAFGGAPTSDGSARA